jgi:hypothetical protein
MFLEALGDHVTQGDQGSKPLELELVFFFIH